jgi:ABC-2 type transport system ATP-binding protein
VNGPAVDIQDLTRRFGGFTAVDHLTLTVERGEIFGFLGANGAGKTTAIRMLCGLLLPTSGTGHVDGLDILRESERIKKSIGYMSQKFALYKDLTARENLDFYGHLYNIDRKSLRERIYELSEQLSLGPFIDRLAGALPMGWRQRLALGAAILHRPPIVFLDEPTAGVDPVFRRTFWELLYEMAEEGTTIFVTTHYMDEAEYCARISIMHNGRLVEMGAPHDLVTRHRAANLENMFIDLIRPAGAVRAED